MARACLDWVFRALNVVPSLGRPRWAGFPAASVGYRGFRQVGVVKQVFSLYDDSVVPTIMKRNADDRTTRPECH